MTLRCRTCKLRTKRVRGVCHGCYEKHLTAVKAGEVTWAQLEERGLTTAPTYGWRGMQDGGFLKGRRR